MDIELVVRKPTSTHSDEKRESQSTQHPIESIQESNNVTVNRDQITKARLQFFALCWAMFTAGWNDGTNGPLLPRIQSVYSVNFTIVSLIFIFACIGFVSGALANLWLTEKLGFGKVLVSGSVCQMIAYTLQSPALPFPVFVMAFTINGVGMAVQDAQVNGYVAILRDNPETKMGILHAVYGVGALTAPLVATQFSSLPHWSFHYLVSLGVATLNTIFLSAMFRLKNQDACRAEIGLEPGEKSTGENSPFRQILSTKTVHILAFFILVYVGIEVTLGGWIVTYIITLRDGGSNSGYISAGFFGGLTAGRLGLLWVNKKLGEENAILAYFTIAIGLELVVWLVPSLIGGGVAVSLVGFFLGPMYPIAMNVSGRVLPRWLLTGAIGWIAGFGQAGSAIFPFITGALANVYGIKTLQPLLLAMMGTSMALWLLVPRRRRLD